MLSPRLWINTPHMTSSYHILPGFSVRMWNDHGLTPWSWSDIMIQHCSKTTIIYHLAWHASSNDITTIILEQLTSEVCFYQLRHWRFLKTSASPCDGDALLSLVHLVGIAALDYQTRFLMTNNAQNKCNQGFWTSPFESSTSWFGCQSWPHYFDII